MCVNLFRLNWAESGKNIKLIKLRLASGQRNEFNEKNDNFCTQIKLKSRIRWDTGNGIGRSMILHFYLSVLFRFPRANPEFADGRACVSMCARANFYIFSTDTKRRTKCAQLITGLWIFWYATEHQTPHKVAHSPKFFSRPKHINLFWGAFALYIQMVKRLSRLFVSLSRSSILLHERSHLKNKFWCDFGNNNYNLDHDYGACVLYRLQ